MSVDQSDTIDFIGIDKESGQVVLTISDHLDWRDTDLHLQRLQEKLNCYMRFCESGEIYESYPNANGKIIIIEICFKHIPNELGLSFLKSAAKIINDSGMELRWQLIKAE